MSDPFNDKNPSSLTRSKFWVDGSSAEYRLLEAEIAESTEASLLAHSPSQVLFFFPSSSRRCPANPMIRASSFLLSYSALLHRIGDGRGLSILAVAICIDRSEPMRFYLLNPIGH